ncbi:MAG: hypothetical protein WC455_25600 [Dehalococcoidia bacterium]|jgi:hypothetical protein
MGRKRIVVDILQIENLAARQLTKEQISDSIGISRKALWRSSRRSRACLAAYERGKAKGLVLLASKVYEKAMGGNFNAQTFILERRGGWRRPDVGLKVDGKVKHDFDEIGPGVREVLKGLGIPVGDAPAAAEGPEKDSDT